MHWHSGANDFPAIGGPDALVTQADAENRDPLANTTDHLRRYAGLIGGARARRDDDVGGRQREYLVHPDGIVSADQRLVAQFLHVPSEVVDEGVVVVDEENHCSR